MASSTTSKSPGAGGAARGVKSIAYSGSSAAIEATALILPHTKGGRNHVVCVRRAPLPSRGRKWLVRYNMSAEFSISRRDLRHPLGFALAATSVEDAWQVCDIISHGRDWTRHLDAMMAEIGGGS